MKDDDDTQCARQRAHQPSRGRLREPHGDGLGKSREDSVAQRRRVGRDHPVGASRPFPAVTGRGQAVLVHVDVGTANTANAMHNLFRSRLPVLLMSGKAPYTSSNELVGSRDTYVHYVQEPFDQGSLVRPYVKWEWTLPSGVVVKEALRRAYSIMQSEPHGPVYLMMQRETLTQHWGVDQVRKFGPDQYGATRGGQADRGVRAQDRRSRQRYRRVPAHHPARARACTQSQRAWRRRRARRRRVLPGRRARRRRHGHAHLRRH